MNHIELKGGPLAGKVIPCPEAWDKPPAGLTQPVWEEGTANLIGFAVYLQTEGWVMEYSHINSELEPPSGTTRSW